MSGISARIREERERLGLSQRAFGEVGGVEANAQGKYENGERTPKADYLARVADRGVDVLYVLTGSRTPVPIVGLSEDEEWMVGSYRTLGKEEQDAICKLTTNMAEYRSNYNPEKKT